MDLLITLGTGGDHTARIHAQIRDAILDGRLAADDRLPAGRELAAQLGVARGTVTTAYERLIAEGFLVGRPGAGTFVTPDAAAAGRDRHAPVGDVRPGTVWSTLPPPVADAPAAEVDLSVGGPDARLFPLPVWRRLVSSTLRPSLTRTGAYDGLGHPELQHQIAQYLGRSRSVQAGADDVLLTSGAQQALDLLSRVLLEPGTVVAVEDPGYTAAIRLFASHRARVIGVPVDGEGLVVDALPRDARLVYVTPSHQFPTGTVMSLRRRLQLLEWAARRDAVVVEDDYDSEFRFDGRPLAPLQSLDRDGRVVYVGSFSKILLPLLRVGYLIAPLSLMPALRQAKSLSDWQGDAVTQGALALFLAEGQLARHLRRTTAAYRPRRAALLAALDALPELTVVPSVAGLHVCARFTDRTVDDVAVAERARAEGLALEPLSPRYFQQSYRPGLVMGIRRLVPEQAPDVIRRIRRALA